MDAPLLELRHASRRYFAGGQEIHALRGIDLDIHAGEMVALIGVSGSGKSTLMNVLGCLDRLSEGGYRIAGQDTGSLDADQLAELRRSYFGFVFQRYNLLPRLTARGNVEIPAIYAGLGTEERHARAGALLERLGLAERLDHRPNELSGGQQQRVSIARALMNGGAVILADEPTGALDSASGREVMELLLELNALGHTLIIATHDPHVAGHARRIIEIADGVIVSDAVTENPGAIHRCKLANDIPKKKTFTRAPPWSRLLEAARTALFALLAHRLRTGLTLLGIVIGIVSVVEMVAFGESAERMMKRQLESFTANSLNIYPGRELGDIFAAQGKNLKIEDVEALREQHYVRSALAHTMTPALARFRERGTQVTVHGVSEDYFDPRNFTLESGVGFNREAVLTQAQVVVIDKKIRRRFFDGVDPLGQIIYIGKLPCVVIGVIGRDPMLEMTGPQTLNILVPYTTSNARLTGRNYLDRIEVRLRDDQPESLAELQVVELLKRRHRAKDFVIANSDLIVKTAEDFSQTMSLLLATVGGISLIVGGVGVMNIMLVSVTERAREIGVRIAVGAHQSDIRRQFLTEAIVVCLFGAAVGVMLSFGLSRVITYFLPPGWELVLSLKAIGAAVLCATLVGVVFGYAPARNAARLDPVEALARD